jgi:hypothetical protein
LGYFPKKEHLDKDGKLMTMMEGYPHGLLAIPYDGYSGQRIIIPVDEQKGLINSTHAEIHHQGHTKVHPASQKELLLSRQRYGIDFYDVHNGEILVMVDLFSKEIMLELLPDRKMEHLYQTIMKRIIFWRGVPDEL